MEIMSETMDVLAECEIKGNTLYLPDRQLDRRLYLDVNKCLENIGGKWNRKAKGHVFDCDPAEALDRLLESGHTESMKKTFQFFPTPRPVAEMMCDMAEFTENCRILDPSCGKGDLMDVIHERAKWEINTLYGIEVNKDMEKYLSEKPYTTTVGVDFLEYVTCDKIRRDWTHIIMNPPFSKQQDIDHILAAYSVLAPDGILISVISPSPFYRTNRKFLAFRRWLEECRASITDVPAGVFKASGTNIATKILKIRKPK